jgi:Flp pilus assembly protein TadD
MEPKKDIYQTPAAAPETVPGATPIQFRPSRSRERTVRSTVGFTMLMLVMLGVSWWVVQRQEQKERKPKLAVPAEPRLPGDADDQPGATAVKPDLQNLSELLKSSERGELGRLDHEKMAEAMGEVRVANQYLEARDWDRAEERAHKALAIWPEMNAAERLLGFVYIQRLQFDQAIAILEHSLEQDPFNTETLNNLASAYLQRWDLEKAEELLLTSLKIRPDYVVSHLNLGLLYLVSGSGKYEMAIDHLERALELVPENVSARNNLAVALLRVGRYTEARKNLESIMKLMPGRASAYFNMAITYVLERDYDEAMAWIRKGAQLCSPVICRSYLNDSDFDAIRNLPVFQEFLKNLYPDLPSLPDQ